MIGNQINFRYYYQLKAKFWVPAKAHNPSRSVSGTVCALYHVEKSAARTADFNQLAVKCVQHHICNHANNCSSLESDKSQGSLVVSPLSSVLVYFCIFFMERFLRVRFKS